MNILAVETSCDETSAAVIKDDYTVLSNVVLSQNEIHAPFGGIVPELASRQHIKSIGYIVDESLMRASLSAEKIDAFAVTLGPGLIGSLLVGVSFSKGLSYYFQKPLIPVDHLQAHVHSVSIENKGLPYPALALLVSGGHTSLFFLKEKMDFQVIGRTRDDAAGEALDKIAKFLELGYPGGPVIDRLAGKGDPNAFPFSLPKMTDKSNDYSFSGLKTAALNLIRKHGITKEHPGFFDFLASFEMGIIKALLINLERAVVEYKPRSLILCGGVARNTKLRAEFENLARKTGLDSAVPSVEYCTDNAAMVAALAMEKVLSGEKISLEMDLNAYPRS